MVDWDERWTAPLIRFIALLPLATALFHAAAIGWLRVQLAPRTIWIVSTTAIGASFLLSAASIFDLVGGESIAPIVDRVGPWLGGGVGARNFSADLTLRLDPLSAVCAVVVTSIALAVYVYVLGRIQGGALPADQVHRLFALLDLLVGSTLVLLLADNLILFFFGWTGVGVAAQLVSSFDFESKRASRAGATTFVIGRVGDLALLAAILLLFDGLARSGVPTLRFEGVAGAFRLLEGKEVELPALLGGGAFAILELVVGLLVVAAISKCAQLPLHYWLAGASMGPASATALIHSATTMVAGCYGLLRCSFLLEDAPYAMGVLVGVGACSALVAALAAANQVELPRIAASATTSAVGFVLVAIGVGAPSTATYLLLSHAYAKAHWLLVLGIVQADRRGEADLRRLGGLARSMRWTHAMAVISGLAVVGVPPIGTFFAQEELFAWLSLSAHPTVFAACAAALGVLAFAIARVHRSLFFGPIPLERPLARVADESAEPRPGQDPPRTLQYALMLLAIFSLSVGFLSPSQFWGDRLGIAQMDTVGTFLSHTLAGAPDPAVDGAARWRTLLACTTASLLGVVVGLRRRRKPRAQTSEEGESSSALGRALRETLYLERAIQVALIRPLRGFSRLLLAGFVEARILDRVLVSGGAGLARKTVWSGLRRLQNGRVQSYAMLGLVALLLSLAWLVG